MCTELVSRLVARALSSGYGISVFNGTLFVLRGGRTMPEVWSALFTTDLDKLYFDKDGRNIGNILLAYGYGPEVICDHSPVPAIEALVAWATGASPHSVDSRTG